MAHIYIYSPSSAVRDKAAFKRGVRVLKSLGHEVELDAAALTYHMRFAGDDATRLAAVARAAASGADVALTSRGGYGLTRILAGLPYKAIAKSIERGTQWVGLSDFTALQLALLAKTGAQSWQGPALGEDFGGSLQPAKLAHAPDDIMLACFDDLLLGRGEGAGWQMSTSDTTKLIAARAHSTPASGQFHIKKGRLWGGNLCVLTSLLGTPYFPQISKGLLFLEDVGEHPYRIERMLTQLLHAGVLARQQAVILGQFSQYKTVAGYDRGFGMASVVAWLRSQLKVPVLTGLPFGHVPTKVLLPVGRSASLSVQGREALIYWG
jgi:muramoyltetrapeptide carboxypeptidase